MQNNQVVRILNVDDFILPKSVSSSVDKEFNGICCALALEGQKIVTSQRNMGIHMVNGKQQSKKSVVVTFNGDYENYLFEFSFIYIEETKIVHEIFIHFEELIFYSSKVKDFAKKNNLICNDGIIVIRSDSDLIKVIRFVLERLNSNLEV